LAKVNQEIMEHSSPLENSDNETSQQTVKTSSAGMLAFVFIAVLISIAAGAFSFFLFQKLEENKSELNGLKLEIGGQLSGKLDGVSGKFNNVTDRFTNVSDRISRFNDELSKIHSSIKQQDGIIKQQDGFLKQQLKQQDGTIKYQENLINNLAGNLQESKRTQEISNQQLTRSLDMLYKQKGKTRNDWILSEVEYLLLIANHSLLLSFDVNTAIIALQSADERLLDMGDPGIITIRKFIADELIQLKAVPFVDVAGIQVILSGMIKHAASLKVLNSDTPTVKDLLGTVTVEPKVVATSEKDLSTLDQYKNSIMKATDKFLHELKSLVVYRNKKVAASALIAPEQKFFLQQHVSLKLESARKALLDGRNELFHSLLTETKQLLLEFFDSSNVSVKNFIEQLDSLQAKNLSRTLPDISFSLKELKKYTAQLDDHRTSEGDTKESN
jgi:uroporphyrin-III C-methyltransferase